MTTEENFNHENNDYCRPIHLHADRYEHTQTYRNKVQTCFLIFCSSDMNDVAALYNQYKCFARIIICHHSRITS